MATEILVKDLRQAFEQARALDGSMAERLDVFADATRKLHPSNAAIVDRLVARLKEHDAGKDAPKPGDVMPPFVLSDENGRLVNLKEGDRLVALEIVSEQDLEKYAEESSTRDEVVPPTPAPSAAPARAIESEADEPEAAEEPEE